jgi:hypothetical protein
LEGVLEVLGAVGVKPNTEPEENHGQCENPNPEPNITTLTFMQPKLWPFQGPNGHINHHIGRHLGFGR